MENQSQTLNEALNNPFSPEIERVIYTTNSQMEIWTDCVFGGSTANKAFNLSVSIKFEGKLVIDILEKAVKTLIKRHECLRATFSPDGRFLCIYSDLNNEISHTDITNLSATDKEESIETIIQKEVNSLFDLVNGPLFKVSLIKIDDSEHLLTLTVHHIIIDGVSYNLLFKELGIIYSAYLENKELNLPDPDRFSEYAEKINSFTESSNYKNLEDYWLSIYNDSVPNIELPIDFKRPSLRTYNSHCLEYAIDDTIINAIKSLGLSNGSSLTNTLLVAFEIFLCKITGKNDVIVGFPFAGNTIYDMRQLIGNCVNLLPLRSKISPDISFCELLKQKNIQLFDAYDHQQVSFGHLLNIFAVPRDASRIPLVPVIMTVDLGHDKESDFSFLGLSHEYKINPREYGTFEIQLHACKTKNGSSFQWTYNTTLFKQESINQMMLTFKEIINKVIANPNSPISEILTSDYLADYNALNGIEIPYPNVNLIELLRKQAKITPNNVALEYHDSKTTYVELHKKVNQLAHYLNEQGVQSGDFIAVSFSHSPELLYALLAIVQCGAAYLPLDPEFPKERLQYMLTDSGAKILLTNKKLSTTLPTWSHTIFIEDAMNSLHQYTTEPLNLTVHPNDLAYILYTSGSTGNPKGVPISHKNLVNFLCSMVSEPGINENDRILSFSTISFDIAGLELYLPLIVGATLVLADREAARDGRLLLEFLENKKINFLQATPTTWLMLFDSGWHKKLPIKALCGGEALPEHLAKKILSKCNTLWNVYGPTETTVWSSVKQIKIDDELITIGKPIANTQFYIIDEQGQLVAPGNSGEIAIGGDGVANGYWNRPELSAEKFIKNPFSTGKKDILYRTGDLGKLLSTNEIECLGRIDQQVKIRGFRIEPGEVEQALLLLDGIKQAVVLASENFLIAHIVPDSSIENATMQIPLWRESLALKLPAHLVPHDFNILNKIPTTPNGKVDRKPLLLFKPNNKLKYTSPRTKEEKLVATIWEESLNIENIDIFSNFFEMGGHSLTAVSVMSKIEQETGVRLSLSVLVEHSTVEKFAKLIENDKDINSDCLVPIKSKGNKVPLFIVHGAGLNVLNFVNLSKHFDEDQPIYGIQGTATNGDAEWYESIEAMAAHYIDAIVKINPKGPYALAGFSFGGIVAFEMTRQLNEQGKKVSLTALLDSYVDSSYYYQTYGQKRLVRYFDTTKKWLDYTKEMILSWEVFKMRINDKKQYILEKHFGVKEIMTEQETLALEQFIEADSKVKIIVDRYHLIPQDFMIDLFRSADDMSYKLDPMHLGWKKAALKGVTIHNIPGNHLEIVAPPNDKILARRLQELLDQKHGNC